MTISSSLSAGVAGLSVNATRLASISDNIANSSTYGYKRVQTDFSSIVISGSSGGSYTAGGVRSTSARLVDERGGLVTTNNATDIAIRGRGMLPVTRATEVQVANGDETMYLTTTGSFRPDSEGYLVSETGLVLMGWEADADGTVPSYPRDTASGLEPVQVSFNELDSEPTTEINLGVNLPATSTDPDDLGTSETLSIEYFDNLGRSESLDFEFEPSGEANKWNMNITDQASGDVVGNYVLTFDDSQDKGGTLASVALAAGGEGGAYDAETGLITIEVDGDNAAGNVNLMNINLGLIGENGGISQLSDPFAPLSISKNGQPVGNLTRVEIDETGFVNAFYDTGLSRVVWQVPVVDMPNPNGLLALDSQTYLPSPDSGPIFLWDAGDGPTGDIVSFAREESTADVAGELTSLIQTQRAYASNAKVIQTVDEMLQETTNIKR